MKRGLTAALKLWCLLTACGGAARNQQVLRPSAFQNACPQTHVRLTVRDRRGLPVGGLTAADFRVTFRLGSSTVIKVVSGSPGKRQSAPTNIFFVVPPFAELNDAVIKPLLATLARADNFNFLFSVLLPNGTWTLPTGDFKQVSEDLLATSHVKDALSLEEWSLKEREAFLALRKRPGRHVLVDLMVPKARESLLKARFHHDHTLDDLAAYDAAQVYRLLYGTDASLTIPVGEAAYSPPMGVSPSTGAQMQQSQLDRASAQQEWVWTERRLALASGGRGETLAAALARDVLEDAAGTYDLTLRPDFPCRPGAMYDVWVSSTRQGLTLYAPHVIQELPEPADAVEAGARSDERMAWPLPQ